jgi:N-acetylglutamate synthase-like GNAT family acetyltransferase
MDDCVVNNASEWRAFEVVGGHCRTYSRSENPQIRYFPSCFTKLKVRVRKAEASDVEPLEAVINQHWKVNIDHRKELANKDALLLVAEAIGDPSEARNTIVGTALMWVTTWNKTGYLVELAVSAHYQRRGIGKALVNELTKLSKENGLRAIIVEAQADNKNGMDFYLAIGFRLCGYNDRYYTNNPKSSHEIALFFSLDL